MVLDSGRSLKEGRELDCNEALLFEDWTHSANDVDYGAWVGDSPFRRRAALVGSRAILPKLIRANVQGRRGGVLGKCPTNHRRGSASKPETLPAAIPVV